MAYYFDREDVALQGFHKYFKEQSDEEREHAQKFMKFQNQRGGSIRLTDVRKPTKGMAHHTPVFPCPNVACVFQTTGDPHWML